jgi:hypothetical protein
MRVPWRLMVLAAEERNGGDEKQADLDNALAHEQKAKPTAWCVLRLE